MFTAEEHYCFASAPPSAEASQGPSLSLSSYFKHRGDWGHSAGGIARRTFFMLALGFAFGAIKEGGPVVGPARK